MRYFIFILCCASLNFAFSQGKIFGKIVDESGSPLYPANIIVSAEKGLATQTDFDGNYTLELPNGRHGVVFTYLGKEDARKIIQIDNEAVELNLTLKTNETIIEIVTVTGGKYEKSYGEETISMEVIPPSILENNAAQANEALNKVPGYTQIGESPSIRGGSGWSSTASSRVLFLVDGVPQLSPENGGIFFETLPLENLQQVEVIKGAASALYGSSALNGIINFRTAWPKDTLPFHRYTTSIGLYQKFDANLIKKKNEKENRMQNPNWWWDDENHLPIFMNHTYEYRQRFDKLDVVFGAHYRHDQSFRKDNETDRFRINGKIRHLSEKLKGFSIGTTFNFVYEEGGQFFLWSGLHENALLPSDPRNPGNSDVRTDIVLRRISISPFVNYYDKKENKHALQTRYYNNQSTNFTLEEVHTNHIFGEYTFTKENFGKGYTLVSGAGGHYTKSKGLTFGNKEYTNANVSGFAQIEKTFFKKLSFTGGLRVEYNSVDSIKPQNKLPVLSIFKDGTITSAVKPLARFGVNYQVAEGTFLRGSFGQGFRVPTINEYFISLQRGIRVAPNPNIIPEAGWSTEIGIKQGVKVGLWQGFFDFAAFYMKYVDLIDFDFSEDLALAIQAQNIDNAKIRGFEMSALGQGKLFGYPLTFLAGYSFIQPTLANADSLRQIQYGETYQFLNYRSKHNVKTDIETTIKDFSFGFSAIYVSHMINIPITQSFVPGVNEYRELNDKGYLTFDIRTRYNFTNKSNLSFIVKNLFNQEYMQRPGILEPPRSYTVQFQHEF